MRGATIYPQPDSLLMKHQMTEIMNTVEQPDYKSVGQLPIIVLLIILFAIKYFNSAEEASKTEQKEEFTTEVNGVANSSTQDLLIKTAVPLN